MKLAGSTMLLAIALSSCSPEPAQEEAQQEAQPVEAPIPAIVGHDVHNQLATAHSPSKPTDSSGGGAFANCSAARAAGAAPVHRGDPGYAPKLDRDGDGIGCE